MAKTPERVRLKDVDVEPSGMRDESLERARVERQLCTEVRSVRIDYWPDRKKPVLSDGRHRVEAAVQAGATDIPAVVTVYGPRGGVRSQRKRAKLVLK